MSSNFSLARRLYVRHGFGEYGRETHPVTQVEMALLRWPDLSNLPLLR